MATLADTEARERATTTTDRNIVVTAGAGTGKTTLLVDRLLHLLVRQRPALTIGEIMALTFTNKAANEMKVRLRTELAKIGNDDLAITALQDLEKSQIGTIHSFAAHLLRLYPIESGVDPSFHQDDGQQFKEHFTKEWGLWLDGELGETGAHREMWRSVLRVVSLQDVKGLAHALAGEAIPLDDPALLDLDEGIPVPVRRWVTHLATAGLELRQAHPKTKILERMLDAAVSCLHHLATSGPTGIEPAEIERLGRDVPAITKGWAKPEHDQAKAIIRVAQSFTTVHAAPLRALLPVLIPFAADCRRRFVQTGYISFDGLLARARALLRDHPRIRRELKRQFRSILVDEFQDTDPVQYEMMLYLAEGPGAEETDWRRVQLEPGKLFIVGDPKQSIYAFRRADMEAYDAVVDEKILGQTPPGVRYTLQTNFRSHHRLLASMNAFFAGVFPHASLKGLQPQSDPLLAYDSGAPLLERERMDLRIVKPDEANADADMASRAEADDLARWLSQEVIGREEIMERGVPVTIKPNHVAILFRTLTGMRDYLEALRRYEIPCLAEGEKHFYERQEIIDAINVLRAAANPHDRLALVGVLRSSVGGISDVEIEALARHHQLDYRIERGRPDGGPSGTVAAIYSVLRALHAGLPRLPLTEVMDVMFAKAPLMELGAASMDGEQALANLLKLRDLTVELARRPDLTFHGLVDELTRRATETPDEAESSLAEDETDESESGALRLLSIHKAKGLEFPMVILAGLHRGTDRREPALLVQHDWSTGILGVRLADLQTVGGIYVGAKLAERQRYEQSRVLYVAMTRAKRRLVLSAGLPRTVPPDSFLSQIAARLDLDLDSLGTDTNREAIPVTDLDVSVNVLRGGTVSAGRLRGEADTWHEADDDVAMLRARWTQRETLRLGTSACPLFTNPTALMDAMSRGGSIGPRSDRPEAEAARWIGTLAHRVLEGWDFTLPTTKLRARVEAVCRFGLPPALSEHATMIVAELQELFTSFAASPPYGDLSRATILGREVPFVFPWEGAHSLAPRASGPAPGASVMEGSIDLVYRLDGEVCAADYKTDRVAEPELIRRAAHYDVQARVYREAISRCLGLERVGFRFIFLRQGTSVSIA